MSRWFSFLYVILGLFLFPKSAFAHAFGKLYNLPVPFWMYSFGGGAAVIVSFLIIGYFMNKKNKQVFYPTVDLSKSILTKFLFRKLFINSLRVISVFLFLLTIATGLFGEDNPYSNFSMTFFWIIFVLGLTYLSAFVGNIYAVMNPWKTLVEWYEILSHRKMKGIIHSPRNLSYWPAFLFYFLFIWTELIGQTTPYRLSIILIHYTIVTIAGVFLMGKRSWFHHCEFFSVFFRIIGKMAIFEVNKGKLYLRPPFIGLLKEKAEDVSLLLFILFMLASTAFDGFRETIPWFRFYSLYVDQALRPILGNISYSIFQTICLLLSPVVFLLIYLILMALVKAVAESKLSLIKLSLQFAFSLVPIAFVYNVAHYYTLLITEGPNIVRLISDPFGNDWNLFNTSSLYIFLIPDAKFVWHSQVGFILIGHIVGVYLAHLVALSIFPSYKKALLSQFPMLFLMVVYTVTGLWILSQPITSGM